MSASSAFPLRSAACTFFRLRAPSVAHCSSVMPASRSRGGVGAGSVFLVVAAASAALVAAGGEPAGSIARFTPRATRSPGAVLPVSAAPAGACARAPAAAAATPACTFWYGCGALAPVDWPVCGETGAATFCASTGGRWRDVPGEPPGCAPELASAPFAATACDDEEVGELGDDGGHIRTARACGVEKEYGADRAAARVLGGTAAGRGLRPNCIAFFAQRG